MINNLDKNVQKINENTVFLNKLMEIANNFPDIQDNYLLEGSNIIIEKSSTNFIKRISIQSKNLNVSINFFNCRFESYHKKYFKHFDQIFIINKVIAKEEFLKKSILNILSQKIFVL